MGGNEGPDPSQVTNVAPCGICVAASSVDRMFPTRIILYNKLLVLQARELDKIKVCGSKSNSMLLKYRTIEASKSSCQESECIGFDLCGICDKAGCRRHHPLSPCQSSM
ncbi:hypothetical protein DVH24_009253 [Malus domestica]|uniref:Uncharacterized protein n=1 Tax=Malus domestica TaxID=3750 RepID=A0A498IJS6_MALDO|nr:hypothetical protein DVH24_009253 [Malus domestica]